MNETNYVGKVKWFNEHRGYGFIVTEDGDFYFHATGLLNVGEPPLKFGEVVSFTLLPSPKGVRAVNVKRIALTDLRGAYNEKSEHGTERR